MSQFRRALIAGRMIKAVVVDPAGDTDDDWVEFEFTEPDAAISPFRIPTG